MPARPTGIMIVAATNLHRAAWQALLGAQPGLHVIGAVAGIAEARPLLAAHEPSAVLVDLPVSDAATLDRLRSGGPLPGVLVLVDAYDIAQSAALLQSGAAGFLRYSASVGELARSLIAVGRGELVLPPELAPAILLGLARGPAVPARAAEHISEREMDVLRLLAQGCTNKDIAQTLVLSVRTVETHLRSIFGKIGARSRTDAAVWAVRHGVEAESS